MIKGVIFDMDGVISDTQTLHSEVESKLLSKFGVDLSPEEITKKYSGVRTSDFFEELLSAQKEDYDIEDLMRQKWRKMSEFASKSVNEIEGSVELIKILHKENIPLAVASASNYDYVIAVLKKLEIENLFAAIVSGDMVNKGKPDPESFLLASYKIRVPPKDCLVIEDGVSGMAAAKKAKMKCVGLVRDYPADFLVSSLKCLSLETLRKV
jgi:HAD superfamily hydrolase (TIGR01509 family)